MGAGKGLRKTKVRLLYLGTKKKRGKEQVEKEEKPFEFKVIRYILFF